MIVGWFNRSPVAIGVWKIDAEDPMVLDVRHVSATDSVAQRMFGSSVVRQIEVRGRQLYPTVQLARGTTKSSNRAMQRFGGIACILLQFWIAPMARMTKMTSRLSKLWRSHVYHI